MRTIGLLMVIALCAYLVCGLINWGPAAVRYIWNHLLECYYWRQIRRASGRRNVKY